MQTLTVLLFTFTLQKIPSQQPLTTACNVFYEGVFCKAFVSSSNRKACVCVWRVGTLLSDSSLYRGVSNTCSNINQSRSSRELFVENISSIYKDQILRRPAFFYNDWSGIRWVLAGEVELHTLQVNRAC